jgi:hypothetical protein
MIISAGDWHWDRHVFEEVFFGGWSYHNFGTARHVAFDDLIIAIIAVMGMLTYIAHDADPDGHPTSGSMQGEMSRGNRGPDFLAAEILPPKKDESCRRPPKDRPFPRI